MYSFVCGNTEPIRVGLQ